MDADRLRTVLEAREADLVRRYNEMDEGREACQVLQQIAEVQVALMGLPARKDR